MKRQVFYHILLKYSFTYSIDRSYLSEILCDLLGVEKGAFPRETADNIKKMHPFIDEVWLSEKEPPEKDKLGYPLPNEEERIQFIIDRIKTKKP